MKYFLITLALLIGLQSAAFAQRHTPKSRHHRSHRPAKQHRHHGPTFYRTHQAPATNNVPSPYRGENTPINDGQKKNKRRNLNYNTGQPLPPNNGGR